VNFPKVMCKAVRPTTGSSIEVEIPADIVKQVEVDGDHSIAVDWIGNELGWQFIPMSFEILQGGKR
jgi:antitoxin component of MazEF toxin-antitoxin module